MSNFGVQGNITDEIMIHVLYLPEEYTIILNGLENYFIMAGPDM